MNTQWISVEDHEPKVSGKYLCTDGDELGILYWLVDHWIDESETTQLEPTHWMPIPEYRRLKLKEKQ